MSKLNITPYELNENTSNVEKQNKIMKENTYNLSNISINDNYKKRR